MENNEELFNLISQSFFLFMDRSRVHKKVMNGLAEKDIIILQKIYTSEGQQMTMSQLSEFLQISAAAASQLVSKYEAKGYLRREHSNVDRRIVYIKVQDDFINDIKNMFESNMDEYKKYLAYLGEEDTQNLRRIMDKTFTYLEGKTSKN